MFYQLQACRDTKVDGIYLQIAILKSYYDSETNVQYPWFASYAFRRESSRRDREKSSPLILGLIDALREALDDLAADVVGLLRFWSLKIFGSTNLVQGYIVK